ncbi:MAG: SRPBCC family protein [Chloroflexi bacterium]|nr:MAG: SRPBCC family protein [Chloroflexota bacterium]
MPGIHLETSIDAPPDIVFDAARDVTVHIESARDTGERAVAGVTHGPMDLGDTVTWEARHFGVPMRLTVRISELDRPRMFADVMVEGPFRSMRHVHRFVTLPTGTRMIDDFEYAAPLGPVGSIASLILTPYLRRFLARRADVLRRLAESRARRSL